MRLVWGAPVRNELWGNCDFHSQCPHGRSVGCPSSSPTLVPPQASPGWVGLPHCCMSLPAASVPTPRPRLCAEKEALWRGTGPQQVRMKLSWASSPVSPVSLP